MREKIPMTGFWVRYIGDKHRTFRYVDDAGKNSRLKMTPGESFTLPRHIAHQLARFGGVEMVPLSDVAESAQRVLVIRYGGLGDVLMSLPAVAEAHRRWPHLSIEFSTLAPYRRVLECNPAISDICGVEAPYYKQPYDVVIDLRRVVEAASDSDITHRSDIFAREFGVELSDYSMHYSVRDDEVEPHFDGNGPFVALQTRGSIPRRTPSHRKVVEIADALLDSGFTPVAIDNHFDGRWSVPGIVNLTGALTIAELFSVLHRSDAVVCGDSGVLHCSNALSKPVVALFGCVDHRLRVKGQPHCVPIQANEYSGCSICNDWQKHKCDNPDTCLDSVPTELVVDTVKQMV